jgi:hypothetical protein
MLLTGNICQCSMYLSKLICEDLKMSYYTNYTLNVSDDVDGFVDDETKYHILADLKRISEYSYICFG